MTYDMRNYYGTTKYLTTVWSHVVTTSSSAAIGKSSMGWSDVCSDEQVLDSNMLLWGTLALSQGSQVHTLTT